VFKDIYGAVYPHLDAAVIPVDYEEYNLDAAARGTQLVHNICENGKDPQSTFAMLQSEQKKNSDPDSKLDYTFDTLDDVVQSVQKDSQSNYDTLQETIRTLQSQDIAHWLNTWREKTVSSTYSNIRCFR